MQSKVWGTYAFTLTSVRSTTLPNREFTSQLPRVARLPGFRALAWSGDLLYASRGYELFRARIQDPAKPMTWQSVAKFRPGWKRTLSAANNLSARLFRDGFHALAVLPYGGIVAAVPGAIVTCDPNATNFAARTPSRAARARSTSPRFPAAQFSGENISTTPPAMKSTSTHRPTGFNAGTSPTHSPKARFATCTTSSTIPGEIACGC